MPDSAGLALGGVSGFSVSVSRLAAFKQDLSLGVRCLVTSGVSPSGVLVQVTFQYVSFSITQFTCSLGCGSLRSSTIFRRFLVMVLPVSR